MCLCSYKFISSYQHTYFLWDDPYIRTFNYTANYDILDGGVHYFLGLSLPLLSRNVECTDTSIYAFSGSQILPKKPCCGWGKSHPVLGPSLKTKLAHGLSLSPQNKRTQNRAYYLDLVESKHASLQEKRQSNPSLPLIFLASLTSFFPVQKDPISGPFLPFNQEMLWNHMFIGWYIIFQNEQNSIRLLL